MSDLPLSRRSFDHGGTTLSYLDTEVDAPLAVCLHAMWMEAGTYASLARALAPGWRVVALDQRGHGYSGHPSDYSREAFVGDVGALLDHLGTTSPVPLIGNSLGATNAFQFAARYPERVSALVNEEGPAEEETDARFMQGWAGTFPTREALREAVGERLFWSVEPSVRETASGWRLAFEVDDMLEVARHLNGDWWDDWAASRCPALVMRGKSSPVVDPELMDRMARERENTDLVVLGGGHVSHRDDPEGFAQAVEQFLAEARSGS